MEKRERLERTISGEKADRVPVALWRHWPGDDQRASDLAAAILSFQRQWDFDFVRVCPDAHYLVADYGLQDEWAGALDGRREIKRPVVTRSLDWTEFRRLDPLRGSLAQVAETLRQLESPLSDNDTPFTLTLYSPLTQARLLAGRETVIRSLRTHPDRLRTGLSILTDNTLRFIESIRKLGIAGLHYEIEFAAYDLLTAAEYQAFGRPYDIKILESLPVSWWLNSVYVAHEAPMLEVVADYPVQVFSWSDRESVTDLSKGKLRFNGAICGGLGRKSPLFDGSPSQVREQALAAISETYGRNFILSTAAPLLLSSPYSNIRTVRQVVEDVAQRL